MKKTYKIHAYVLISLCFDRIFKTKKKKIYYLVYKAEVKVMVMRIHFISSWPYTKVVAFYPRTEKIRFSILLYYNTYNDDNDDTKI